MAKKQASKNAVIIVISVIAAMIVVAVAIFLSVRYKNGKADITQAATDDGSDTVLDSGTSNPNLAPFDTVDTDAEQTEADDTPAVTTQAPSASTQTITTKSYSKNGANGGKLTCEYPYLECEQYPEAAAKFNQLVSDKLASFDSLIASDGDESAQAVPVTVDITYKVFKNDGGIISVLFTQSGDLGGAQSSTSYFSINYGLPMEAEFTLKDLANGDDEYKKSIATIIYEKVKAEQEKYYPDLSVERIAECLNEHNFVQSDNGIVIYFEDAAIAPYAAGFCSFDISYNQLSIIY